MYQQLKKQHSKHSGDDGSLGRRSAGWSRSEFVRKLPFYLVLVAAKILFNIIQFKDLNIFGWFKKD